MKYIFKKKYLILLMTVFDFVGCWIFRFLNLFSLQHSNSVISRILLIRLDHIGDVVMATALLKVLRSKHPKTIIDIMVPVWAADIIKENPYVDNVIVFTPTWFSRNNVNIFFYYSVPNI